MGSKKLLGLIHWVKSLKQKSRKHLLSCTSWHGELLSFVRLWKQPQILKPNILNYQPLQPSHPTFFNLPPQPTSINPPQPKQWHSSHMVDFSSMLNSYTPNQPTNQPKSTTNFNLPLNLKKIPLPGLRYIRPPVLSHWSVRNTLLVDFQKPKNGSVMAWDVGIWWVPNHRGKTVPTNL